MSTMTGSAPVGIDVDVASTAANNEKENGQVEEETKLERTSSSSAAKQTAFATACDNSNSNHGSTGKNNHVQDTITTTTARTNQSQVKHNNNDDDGDDVDDDDADDDNDDDNDDGVKAENVIGDVEDEAETNENNCNRSDGNYKKKQGRDQNSPSSNNHTSTDRNKISNIAASMVDALDLPTIASATDTDSSTIAKTAAVQKKVMFASTTSTFILPSVTEEPDEEEDHHEYSHEAKAKQQQQQQQDVNDYEGNEEEDVDPVDAIRVYIPLNITADLKPVIQTTLRKRIQGIYARYPSLQSTSDNTTKRKDKENEEPVDEYQEPNDDDFYIEVVEPEEQQLLEPEPEPERLTALAPGATSVCMPTPPPKLLTMTSAPPPMDFDSSPSSNINALRSLAASTLLAMASSSHRPEDAAGTVVTNATTNAHPDRPASFPPVPVFLIRPAHQLPDGSSVNTDGTRLLPGPAKNLATTKTSSEKVSAPKAVTSRRDSPPVSTTSIGDSVQLQNNFSRAQSQSDIAEAVMRNFAVAQMNRSQQPQLQSQQVQLLPQQPKLPHAAENIDYNTLVANNPDAFSNANTNSMNGAMPSTTDEGLINHKRTIAILEKQSRALAMTLAGGGGDAGRHRSVTFAPLPPPNQNTIASFTEKRRQLLPPSTPQVGPLFSLPGTTSGAASLPFVQKQKHPLVDEISKTGSPFVHIGGPPVNNGRVKSTMKAAADRQLAVVASHQSNARFPFATVPTASNVANGMITVNGDQIPNAVARFAAFHNNNTESEPDGSVKRAMPSTFTTAPSEPAIESPTKKAKLVQHISFDQVEAVDTVKRAENNHTRMLLEDRQKSKIVPSHKAKEVADSLHQQLIHLIRAMTDEELPRRKRKIKVSLTCPPGRRPGDGILFSNPLDPNQRLRVKIPEGCFPGDSFKVSVPVKHLPEELDSNNEPIDHNRFSAGFQELLGEYSTVFDEWCFLRAEAEPRVFSVSKEKQQKFEQLVTEFSSKQHHHKLMTPVTADYLEKIVKKVRPNQQQHEPQRTSAMAMSGPELLDAEAAALSDGQSKPQFVIPPQGTSPRILLSNGISDSNNNTGNATASETVDSTPAPTNPLQSEAASREADAAAAVAAESQPTDATAVAAAAAAAALIKAKAAAAAAKAAKAKGPSPSNSKGGIQPTPQDVLLGRGKSMQNYPGNQFLFSIIEQNFKSYVGAKKTDKTRHAIDIVKFIKEQAKGRFLRRKTIDGEWEEVSDHIARDKVSHGFRNKWQAHKRLHRAIQGEIQGEDSEEDVNL